tara:strand:- start:561 stop:926 length:366 start_codon:yes stop_codon:yes gene_type:complete
MSLKVYEVSFFYDDTKTWEVKDSFKTHELADQYCEEAVSRGAPERLNITMSMIKPVVWKILHDEEGLIWTAYNTDNLNCHLLQDQIQDVWDPDPAVPQVIIEWFWSVKKEKGFYPAGTILD